MTARRGSSALGCLVTLLFIAAVSYFGVNVAQVYWRYYQFSDDMQQAARFGQHTSTDAIVSRLRASADSLDLPEAAGHVIIRRADNRMSIESDYYERVEVPGYVQELHFHPRAEARF